MSEPAVAFETSTRRPSVALRADGRLTTAELDAERPHASDLLPTLDGLLRTAGVRPEAVAAVAVGVGPGSYTGLRVGVATAAGIARAAGAALVAVPSGEALAWRELALGETGLHLVDARSRELYAARYERTADDVVVRTAPRVVAPSDVGDLLRDGEALFADDAALAAAGLDDPPGRRVAVPSAGALLELALARLGRGVTHDPDTVEPLYLRPFAARVRKRR